MIIKDLIEELKKQNPDDFVFTKTGKGNFRQVRTIATGANVQGLARFVYIERFRSR